MDEGARLRNEGMARVEGHPGDAPWRAAADREMDRLARSGEPFTAEDLIAAIGPPERENAVGARIGSWSRRGLIESIGYQKAAHPDAHARRILTWRGTAKARETRMDEGRYKRVEREGKPDQYIDLRKAQEEEANRQRINEGLREDARLQATPRHTTLPFGVRVCPRCHGSGGNMKYACTRCAGEGWIA